MCRKNVGWKHRRSYRFSVVPRNDPFERIRTEREQCCDEIALSVSGDRLEYAKALTLMAQWEAGPAVARTGMRK